MINWFKKIGRKFSNAIKGMMVMIREEKSLWVHFFVTLVVIVFGVIFNVTFVEWIGLVLSIVIVISFEIMNTSIEYLVDIVSFEYNIKAKKIKDVSAMATFVVTIGAVIVGFIIFIPHIAKYFGA